VVEKRKCTVIGGKRTEERKNERNLEELSE
jgi:hypothetical protein